MEPLGRNEPLVDASPPARPLVPGAGSSDRRTESAFPLDRIDPGPSLPLRSVEPSASGADLPDLPGLLKALRRRWRLAAFGGMACASLSAVAVYLLVPAPKYTTSALVHVSEKRPREIFETRESDVGYRTYQETQVILAKSRKVLSAALEGPEAAGLPAVLAKPDPIVWLAEQLKVDFPRGSEILSISLTASCPPRDLSTLVNAIADAYLTQIVEQERLDRVARVDRLKALFADYQKSLTEKRTKFKELAGTIGTSNKAASAIRQQSMVEHLGLARQELMRLQAEVRRSQARLNVLTSRTGGVATSNREDFEPEAEAAADPQVLLIQDQLSLLQAQRTRLKRSARKGGADPAVQAVDREIKQLSKDLEARRRAFRPAATEPDGAPPPPVEDDRVREVEEYVEILHEQEKVLVQEIASLETQMSTLNVKSMDFHWLEDEIDVASSTAKLVGAEVQSMTVEMQAPPRIRLIERASVPTLSDPLRRHKLGGAAGVGGFFVGLGCVSFWEFRRRRVDMPEDVTARLGLRLIGDLPRLERGRPSNRVGKDGDRLVQSIDAVRTMLLSVDRHQAFQVVLITSALKGEGKSSLACHLATSLARAGRRALLIDCDLRKPSLHDVFQFPAEPGLCDVLRGEVGWEDVVRQAPVHGLSVLAAGRCDRESIELLSREPFPELMRSFRDRFDFIIVDSAPVLQVTDTLVVSQHVDAVLFSVLRDVSRLPQIHAAFERLASMGVRILGAVVAGVPARSSYYYGTYPARG